MSRRRVVITGVGAVTPLGLGARELAERWIAGECAIRDGEGDCAEFDVDELLSKKEARRADRFTQLAMVASDEAIADVGWQDELPYPADRVGCVIASGIGGLGSLEREHTILIQRGAKALSPLGIPLLMPNAAAGAVAMRHGLGGQAFGVVSACAAGTNALGTAMRTIQYGDADAVVAGGAEATLTPLARGCFGAMGALSVSGDSRPFDARRDGFVMGEGAGVLVLEERDAAIARGANILGELIGFAATADHFHLTAPEPSGKAAARAIELALKDAGLTTDDVDYVNAHGTSTQLNDAAETKALKTVLGERAHDVPISSLKSAIGHLLGAAGAVEAIATVLALRARTVPPTLGYGEPEEGLDLDYVTDGARPLDVNGRPAIAISNSFGFGGHNAVVALAVEAA